MNRRSVKLVAVVALALVLGPLAMAQSFLNKTVKIKKADGRVIVAKVVAEEAGRIKVQTKLGAVWISRTDITEITSFEDLLAEFKKRKEAAKTGEDYYQVAVWAEKNDFERPAIREVMELAVKADTDHEGAREWLGYKKTPNGRGGFDWVYVGEKRKRGALRKKVEDKKAAIKDRPWDEYEEIYLFPQGSPIYEIHTNCPEDIARKYGEFMVKLKSGLSKLVVDLRKKPIQWIHNDRGKVFICNSQRLFMEITGQVPGVGGFYTPGFFPAGEAERCIVAFHGTFGASGDTFKVLAHEGTHQLQGRMWKGNFSSRPPWLIEGLAVYFGDGHYIDKDGQFKVGIPRDRLNNLRRGFRAGPGKYIPLKSLLYTPYQQFGGYHYAHGWGLIYWMLHSGESLSYKGKTFDLKTVFGDFFERNMDQGFMHLPALFGARTREEVIAVADMMEEPWKAYLNGLTPPSVGVFDKKNPRLFVSKKIGFKLEAPKKRRGKEWKFVEEVDLADGELAAIELPGTSARFAVSQRANSDAELNVDLLAKDLEPFLGFKYENLQRLPDERTSWRGQPIFAMNFTAKEAKNQMNDNPNPNELRVKIRILLAGENYFTLYAQANKDEWSDLEEELQRAFDGFSLTVD